MILIVNPTVSLIHETVDIVAEALLPNTIYTFVLRLFHHSGTYASTATFKSDKIGQIDLKADAPIRGTYEGADINGLFDSVLPSENVIRGAYVKCTPPDDFSYELSVLSPSGDVLLTRNLKKIWKHPDVDRFPVVHNNVVGVIFRPAGDRRFPAIIDISGTGGGLHEHKAAALACRGFLVFALPFFKYKGQLPEKLSDVDISYFCDAIDYLSSRPDTLDMVGMQGVSLGSLLTQIVATKHQKLKACILINGATQLDEWTVVKDGGFKMPHIETDYKNIKLLNQLVVTKMIYGNVPDKKTRVKYEHTSPETSFRFVAALDDLSVQTVESTNYCAGQLRNLKRNVEVDFVAGSHLMEPPCFPYLDSVFASFIGSYQAYGSCVAYQHGRSQRLIWERTVQFFQKQLGKPEQMRSVSLSKL